MRIGIVVDHPLRDLAGATKLALAVAQRGAQAFLIPLYQQGIDVPLLGLNALIVNFARPANFEFVSSCKAAGISVYVLDTEGGVLTESGANAPHKLAAFVRDSGFAPLLSGYFFWGQTLRDAFAEQAVLPGDRLWVTGCPRFDFASAPWSGTLDYASDGYVLVNANFPLVNPMFAQSPEAERQALVSAGWDGAYVDDLILTLRTTFERYLAAVGAVARQMPGKTLLVRPHPFESSEPYLQHLGGLPNVVIERRGSVLNVIQHSQCVIHLNCGTAVESLMLGRLPVSLEFLNTPLLLKHTPLPSRISYAATDIADVCRAVEAAGDVLARLEPAALYRQWIHPWFHANDGSAAERVADLAIAHAARTAARVSVGTSLRSSKVAPTLLQRGQAALANLTGSLGTARLRAAVTRRRAAKHITAEEVRGIASRLAACKPGVVSPIVERCRHPVSRLPLASISIRPAAASA